jgi:hypothetical protein
MPQARKSWSLREPITILEETNALALTNPWVMIWNRTKPAILIVEPRNITPKCTEVLNAIIFLESNQLLRNIDITITAENAIPNPKFMYHIDNVTLATTIVDECSKEETGVGLSIAIGSQ